MLFRRKGVAAVLAMLILSVLLCVQSAMAELAFSFLPTRTHDGVVYEARPPAELTTILLIGYDHYAEGLQEELHGYSNGGQADFLLLVVLDHKNETIRMLQLDRDTMTSMLVTDSKGKQHTRKSLQLCLAHAYGDTREKNNANTVQTVENLLGIGGADDGAKIDWYMAMDISGISHLNDLLGGVTVTITDDMSHIDPAMVSGATLKLTGQQAEAFCRARFSIGDMTNASRMVRQRQYLSAAGELFMSKLREDVNFGGELLEGMGVIYDRTKINDDPFSFSDASEGTPSGEADGRYLMTSETKGGIIAVLSRVTGYQMLEIETLPGEHVLSSDGYIHFNLQDGAALEWVLETFYRTER